MGGWGEAIIKMGDQGGLHRGGNIILKQMLSVYVFINIIIITKFRTSLVVVILYFLLLLGTFCLLHTKLYISQCVYYCLQREISWIIFEI